MAQKSRSKRNDVSLADVKSTRQRVRKISEVAEIENPRTIPVVIEAQPETQVVPVMSEPVQERSLVMEPLPAQGIVALPITESVVHASEQSIGVSAPDSQSLANERIIWASGLLVSTTVASIALMRVFGIL